jgi:sugar/nucleoside kinase (ribokinase family)
VPVRFAVVGDLLIDLNVAGRGHSALIELRPGGSALNVATWAVACGAEATVVGRVGDDLAGRALRAYLSERGIGAELTVDGSSRTGTFAIVDGAIRVDQGASGGEWEPAYLPPADVALVSGYLAPETVQSAVEGLEAKCVGLAVGRLPRVVPGVDVVLASASEAERLTGARDPEVAARTIAEDARLACVTLGADGAVAAGSEGVTRGRPPRRHPDGAGGAGDAFAAGFLLALAGGGTVKEALQAGCAVGARAAAVG